jgi:hypothetical protein
VSGSAPQQTIAGACHIRGNAPHRQSLIRVDAAMMKQSFLEILPLYPIYRKNSADNAERIISPAKTEAVMRTQNFRFLSLYPFIFGYPLNEFDYQSFYHFG